MNIHPQIVAADYLQYHVFFCYLGNCSWGWGTVEDGEEKGEGEMRGDRERNKKEGERDRDGKGMKVLFFF